ncbi:hypothetical protein IW261DRAFT_1570126 [Armillaria novae-zelandiae]|uniref:Uncharacterized protein n=1 Tax=Armillaria novae-zelandiae TaxID=153914 RepID=A0AA39NWA1_9AGAR|nr:hypothetical protein IW261DRAFT_1570126 [Armillaria novae-zelandiae]
MATAVLSHVEEDFFITFKAPLSIALPDQEPPMSGALLPSPIFDTAPYMQIDPIYAFKVITTGIGDYDRPFALYLERYFTMFTTLHKLCALPLGVAHSSSPKSNILWPNEYFVRMAV